MHQCLITVDYPELLFFKILFVRLKLSLPEAVIPERLGLNYFLFWKDLKSVPRLQVRLFTQIKRL